MEKVEELRSWGSASERIGPDQRRCPNYGRVSESESSEAASMGASDLGISVRHLLSAFGISWVLIFPFACFGLNAAVVD